MAASTRTVVPPRKVDRLVILLESTLAELQTLSLDDATRARLLAMHRDLVIELASALSDAEVAEMVTLGLGPLPPDASDDELRVAQAQLLGWAHGVAASTRPDLG